MTGLLVVASGGLGAGLRFLVSDWMTRRVASEFPWGTTVVNGIGAVILGGVVGSGIDGTAATVLVGGMAGFTTYSTWMVESVSLWQEGRGGHVRGLANWLGMFAAGVGLAWLGWMVGSMFA